MKPISILMSSGVFDFSSVTFPADVFGFAFPFAFPLPVLAGPLLLVSPPHGESRQINGYHLIVGSVNEKSVNHGKQFTHLYFTNQYISYLDRYMARYSDQIFLRRITQVRMRPKKTSSWSLGGSQATQDRLHAIRTKT